MRGVGVQHVRSPHAIDGLVSTITKWTQWSRFEIRDSVRSVHIHLAIKILGLRLASSSNDFVANLDACYRFPRHDAAHHTIQYTPHNTSEHTILATTPAPHRRVLRFPLLGVDHHTNNIWRAHAAVSWAAMPAWQRFTDLGDDPPWLWILELQQEHRRMAGTVKSEAPGMLRGLLAPERCTVSCHARRSSDACAGAKPHIAEAKSLKWASVPEVSARVMSRPLGAR